MKKMNKNNMLETELVEENKKEVKINEFLTVKCEDDDIKYFVGNKNLGTPVHSLLEILLMMLSNKNMSMDEIVEILDELIGINGRNDKSIDLEVEFNLHCIYLKMFVESRYNAKLLHRYDVFPLLEHLYYAGDPLAKEVFRKEIIKRFLSGKVYVVNFLFPHYARWLPYEDIKYILEKGKSLYKAEDFKVIVLNFTQSLYDNGLRYSDQGNYERVIEILNNALKLSPFDISTLKLLGESYFNIKKYNKAIEIHSKIVEIDYSQDLYHTSKKWYDFDKSISLRYIAESYVAKDELDKAMEVCNRILEVNHETFNPYDILSEIYQKKGDKKESKIAYKKYKKKRKANFKKSKKEEAQW